MMLVLRIILISLFALIIGASSIVKDGTVSLFKNGNKSYHIAINYRMNFFQAMRYCRHLNMSLLTIKTQRENEFILKLLQSEDAGREFWSSGSRLVDGKSWLWLSDGEAIEYTNWDNGQPSTQIERCIDLRFDGRNQLFWHDENCFSERPFVCEKFHSTEQDPTLLWSKISRSSPSIYADILRHGNKIFYFSRQFRGNFWKSAQFCELIGMKSASIENADENAKLYKYIRDTNADPMWWTSGTKMLDDVTWFWLSNGHKTQYMNWQPMEPSGGAERCLQVTIDKIKADLFFHDFDCNVELPVICEKYIKDNNRLQKRETEQSWLARASLVKSTKTTGSNVYHIETKYQGDYQQAQDFCNYLNMDLVDINSGVENKAIVNELDLNDEDGPFWTSGYQYNTEWFWKSTKERIDYKNWKTGRPHVNQNNGCILIDKFGRWIDHQCNDDFPFICKERQPSKAEDDEECKQTVINVYIDNNAVSEGDQIFRPVRIEDQSLSNERSYLVKNSWHSCK